MLVSLGNYGNLICEVIWNHCDEFIRAIDVQKCIQIDEKSVGIFRTLKGQLYNTDVIEQFVFFNKVYLIKNIFLSIKKKFRNADDAIALKNVKRESKLYSYKEQMAELQLRKELAEKNRREGKLTERQTKAVEEELKKEQVGFEYC